MALYFIKPVVWNGSGYRKPGGGRFTSGYPKENGFGHEEWNNADHLEYSSGSTLMRAFHTEGFKRQRLDEHANEILIFLIAAHEGKQYLVGAAAGARYLWGDSDERKRLAKVLGVDSVERAREAWELPQVQQCFNRDWHTFLKKWREESQWSVTWTCPKELFLWLPKPVVIDPLQVTGKKRFISMFSSFDSISRYEALRILRQVRSQAGIENVLSRLTQECMSDDADMASDILDLNDPNAPNETTKQALIQARRGQGALRAALVDYWRECAVTGCRVKEVLRASHIKPWRESTNSERLNPQNGLLLHATLDALFDVGLISFDESGVMLISSKLDAKARRQLGITPSSKLSKPSCPTTAAFLDYHRRKIYADALM